MVTLLTATWNYHERLERGRPVITTWTSKARLSKKAQANLERSLDQLKQLPKSSWSKPQPASNVGDHIYVIRFRDETRAQLRVFGHFYDEHSAFVMTLDGYEKDDVYYPHDYQAVGKRHKSTCDANFPKTTIKFKDRCSLCPKEGTSKGGDEQVSARR